ncbi:MAG: S-layer homology domain-containing protein, partial [Clostridium sp.]|nr:S-layer homology domain-containing protein [Clostridium sp.]
EDYIKMSRYYGILVDNLENFKVDAKVSREDMCKSLIRFLGYDKIAQCSDIFVLNFKDAKDVSKENTGYIALAKGLNLISLDKNNNLNPKKIITNEELALGLYRALQLKQVNYIGHYPMK